MRIAFIHDDKAFLPDIAAYQRYFSRYPVKCEVVKRGESRKIDRQVDWFFMGSDLSGKQPGIVKIHEYLSASLPPFRQGKDLVKRLLNSRPDYRLFLSPYVRNALSLTDSVPFGYRDMGIWPDLLQPAKAAVDKRVDFIYCGSVSPDIGIEKVLDCFRPGASMEGRSILVVSRAYEILQERYKAISNIQFIGPVPHAAVPGYIHQAHFSISFKPDTEPHRSQTITKLLEYAGCGIPVITSDIPWVRHFQQQYAGQFFYLLPDLSNFNWANINACTYQAPDLRQWTWEKQIEGSGIITFLQGKFPDVFA